MKNAESKFLLLFCFVISRLILFEIRLRNGIKYCRVIDLPEVLCIHLKRFRHDSMIYTKIGSYVSFPLVDLDMTSFIHKGLFISLST